MTTRRPEWIDLRSHLQQLFDAAIEAADPAAAVRRHLEADRGLLRGGPHRLPLAPEAKVWLLGAGKASPAMARAALDILGERVAGGVVAHSRGVTVGGGWPERIRLFPAGHPLPDEGSLLAGEAAIELMRRCAARAVVPGRDGAPGEESGDLALALLSGGGSAMLEALPEEIGLEDLRAITDSLGRAGADIRELNAVRRALSRLKGGGLRAHAVPARCLALLLSDVVGDRVETIASGPTVPSPVEPARALEILDRHRMRQAHPRIVRALTATAERGAQAPAGSFWHVIASNRSALEGVRRRAAELGFRPVAVTDRLQGEARRSGRRIGALARSVAAAAGPAPAPICLIFGGETTSAVCGPGRGGRNLELALAAAGVLDGCARAAVFSFATDGSDGNSGAAGAIVTGESMRRAAGLGLSAERAVAESDTEPFFRALGDLWTSGPTGTNVNDVALALVYG